MLTGTSVAVVGCGYVGLVSAACLADVGADVTAIDTNAERVAMLCAGEPPIYEPGLREVIGRNMRARLRFTTDHKTVAGAAVVLVCVGTPSNPNGSCDTSAVFACVRQIAPYMDDDAVLVIRSTVPPGTASRASDVAHAAAGRLIDVVSCPEFLAEGSALADMRRSSRVVVGTASARAAAVVGRLFVPFVENEDAVLVMSNASAELTKYANNTFLAARVSLINEIAAVATVAGADIEHVAKAVGSDPRIGSDYLKAGIGYGGSCLPKDTAALYRYAAEGGVDMSIVRSVIDRNNDAPNRAIEALGSLPGTRVAVIGLAFKPNTDDTRESPAVVVCRRLASQGADVVVFDPNAKTPPVELPEVVTVNTGDVWDTVAGADCLFVATDVCGVGGWDWLRVADLMRGRVVVDGRNVADPDAVRAAGLEYHAIGRS